MPFQKQKVQFIGGPLDGEWRRLDLPLPRWFDTPAVADAPTIVHARYGLVSSRNGRQTYVLTQLLQTAAGEFL